MPKLLCLLVDHAPYGTLQPGEAIRHARGALGKGWEVVLALMGNAVYTALIGQSPGGDWICLGEALNDFVREGGARARVLVDGASLEERGLAADDLVPGVRLIELGEIAAAMADCNRTLIF